MMEDVWAGRMNADFTVLADPEPVLRDTRPRDRRGRIKSSRAKASHARTARKNSLYTFTGVPERGGCVYFVMEHKPRYMEGGEMRWLMRVGFTTNIAQRMSNHVMHSPVPLRLWAVLAVGKEWPTKTHEGQVHELLMPWAVGYDWFDLLGAKPVLWEWLAFREVRLPSQHLYGDQLEYVRHFYSGLFMPSGFEYEERRREAAWQVEKRLKSLRSMRLIPVGRPLGRDYAAEAEADRELRYEADMRPVSDRV